MNPRNLQAPLPPAIQELNAPLRLLENLRIVLIEPQGAANVGAVARALENFGVSDLVTVRPSADIRGKEARAMAASAQETLARTRTVETFDEALADCVFAVAFSGCAETRPRDHRIYQAVLPEILPVLAERRLAFVFGREDHGLDTTVMDRCRYLVQIPTHPQNESLNLAQAVLLAVYSLYTAEYAPHEHRDPKDIYQQSATFEERENLYRDLEKTLVTIGLIHPNAVDASMRNVRRFLERRDLRRKEAKLLRGLCRQLRWANENL